MFVGNMIVSLNDPDLTIATHHIGFWAGMQGLTAIVIFLAHILTEVALAFASAKLMGRVRTTAFAAILRQDTLFFAKCDDAPGA